MATNNKRPAPVKPATSPEDKEEALIQRIGDLALALAEQEQGRVDEMALQADEAAELQKIIRKCLLRKEDVILYEGLERAKDMDIAAWQLLRDTIAEASEVAVIRREQNGKTEDMEINAFVIPVFARTDGGLHADQDFTDQDAFEQLSKSIQDAGLESGDAKVVLISHAYHLDEIDSITYSHLSDMLRDVYSALTDKKARATPAIDRSLSGWPDNLFLPGDQAIELRFLLGFALKRVDDKFYRVPEDEAGMDAYFIDRAVRFQKWTTGAAPLLQRLLVTDGRAVEVNFLYQDLFHGGKERGIAEYFMLQMMSALNQGLDDCGVAPEATRAVAGPVGFGGDIFLRVNLYRKSDDVLVVTAEKPFGAGVGSDQEIENEIDDVYDALGTIGVESLEIAAEFDAKGHPLEVRPY